MADSPNPLVMPSNNSAAFAGQVMSTGDTAFDTDLDAIRVGDGSTPGGRIFRNQEDADARTTDAVEEALAPRAEFERDKLVYRCSSAQGANVNEWAVTLPTGVELIDGALYRFPIPTVTTGAIRIVVGGINQPFLYDNGAPVGAEADLAPPYWVVTRWEGGNANLMRYVSATVEAARMIAVEAATASHEDRLDAMDTADAANASRLTYRCTAGQVGGDPNHWAVTLPFLPPPPDALFYWIAPSTPTGELAVDFYGTGGSPKLYNGGPVNGAERGIIAGYPVYFRYEGGNANVLRYEGSAVDNQRINGSGGGGGGAATGDPLAVFRAAVADTPYGTVTRDGSGNAVLTPISWTALGQGSSVNTEDPARAGGAAPGTSPSAVLKSRFEASYGPYLQIKNANTSHGGHVVTQFPGQYLEASSEDRATAVLNLQIPGMNDFDANGYNTGPTFPLAVKQAYRDFLLQELGRGRVIPIATTPTYHIGRTNREVIAPGNPQIWPYYVDAPVPTGAIVPPSGAASFVNRDRTGHGIISRGSLRYDHGNALIRQLAHELHSLYPAQVILLDAAYSFWRNLIEPQIKRGTDPVAALDIAYPNGEFVHPGEIGQRFSYGFCIGQMWASLEGPFNGQWIFTGEGCEQYAG